MWPTIIQTEYLQFLNTNVLSNDECRLLHMVPNNGRISDGTLCAFSRQGHGVCIGDYGSPLISNGQLVGVASWGKLCATGEPDQYTRISSHLNFIHRVTGVVAV